MSARRHRELARNVRLTRRLSKDPRWVADVVLSALRHVGITAAELRALADAAAAAAAPRLRTVEGATRGGMARVPEMTGAWGVTGTADQVVEPVDRKSAAAGDR